MERREITLTASDGVELEGELALPDHPAAGVVLCHPHPLHGGSMRSVVIGHLFEGLTGTPDDTDGAPVAACLRFNFRGVGGSQGEHTEGLLERLDATAALEHLAGALPEGMPLVMAGWSFGADVALSVGHDRHAGWIAIAPPLRVIDDDRAEAAGADPRPKLVVLGQHDQVVDRDHVEQRTAGWAACRVEVIGGADHFFIGRGDRLVAAARDFLSSVT